MDKDRQARADAKLKELFGRWDTPYEDMSDFQKTVMPHLFGDVWSRPGLSTQERSLITLAVLVAKGHEKELKIHLRAALNIGLDRKKIEEMILHVAHYAGIPAGRSACEIAQEVFDKADTKSGKAKP